MHCGFNQSAFDMLKENDDASNGICVSTLNRTLQGVKVKVLKCQNKRAVGHHAYNGKTQEQIDNGRGYVTVINKHINMR